MQQRTVIELSVDGNTLFTRQALNGVPGTARQRRKAQRRAAERPHETACWHKIGRAIFRNGKVPSSSISAAFPGLEILPLGAPEISQLAAHNAGVARQYAALAATIVSEIEQDSARFAVKPVPRLRVVFEEVSETDEAMARLQGSPLGMVFGTLTGLTMADAIDAALDPAKELEMLHRINRHARKSAGMPLGAPLADFAL